MRTGERSSLLAQLSIWAFIWAPRKGSSHGGLLPLSSSAGRPPGADGGGVDVAKSKGALDFEAARGFAGVSGSGFAAAVEGPWRAFADLDSLPLIKSGYSLEADMKFGWKPTVKGKVLPIPLVFDTEDGYFDLDHYPEGCTGRKKYPVIF